VGSDGKIGGQRWQCRQTSSKQVGAMAKQANKQQVGG